MSDIYKSRDGHWTVSPVSLDGVQLLRVEHSEVQLPDGSNVPDHSFHGGLTGITQTANGYLVAEVKTVADVSKWVPLAELESLAPHVSK